VTWSFNCIFSGSLQTRCIRGCSNMY
jgi:hypothetical protein